MMRVFGTQYIRYIDRRYILSIVYYGKKHTSPESHCDSRTPNATSTQGYEITLESISGNICPEIMTHTYYCTKLFKESRIRTQVGKQDFNKKHNTPHRSIHLEKFKETVDRRLKSCPICKFKGQRLAQTKSNHFTVTLNIVCDNCESTAKQLHNVVEYLETKL